MKPVETPTGWELVTYPPASAGARKTRPASHWKRKLSALDTAGGADGWTQFAGFSGSDVGSLIGRGALLAASRGRQRLYRLTDYGVRVARGFAK